MFWKSKTKNSGMYNTLSIPANLVNWTQSGTNWNGILTEATMLANNIDYTRVMNVVPQWSQATNGNGWVTTISRSSADNNIYITLTRGSGGSSANAVTLDTQQTITGDKQFNANVEFNKVVVVHNGTNDDCSFAVQRDASHANYMGFYNGNARLGFIGKASQNDTTLTLKAETGDLVLNASGNVNASNKKITNLATPTANNDAATKAYADGCKNGNNWTTINNISNIGTLNDTWTRITDYTNNQNSFSVENGGTYQVMFKCNTNGGDIYCSCVLACNAADYDNCGFSSVMYWNNSSATPDTSTIQFAIYLKNNQFKLYARRPSGTNTNWNTGTRIYVRKIAQGNIQ